MTQLHEMGTTARDAANVGTRLHELLEQFVARGRSDWPDIGDTYLRLNRGDTIRMESVGIPTPDPLRTSAFMPEPVTTELTDRVFAAHDRYALAPRTWLA